MFNVGLEFWIWEVLSGIWNVEIVWHGNCSVENGFYNWSCFGFLAPVSVLEFCSCCCYGSWTIKFLSQEARRWGDWSCFGADQAFRPRWSRHWHLMSMSNHNPSRWCFCNAPSECALTKYPSACHLAFYKLLENMHNLWGEAYWRNGCCMNPACTATRRSINCTLMRCNLCFRFLIFTKEVQDLLSQNICTTVFWRYSTLPKKNGLHPAA